MHPEDRCLSLKMNDACLMFLIQRRVISTRLRKQLTSLFMLLPECLLRSSSVTSRGTLAGSTTFGWCDNFLAEHRWFLIHETGRWFLIAKTAIFKRPGSRVHNIS